MKFGRSSALTGLDVRGRGALIGLGSFSISLLRITEKG
jgi:hypothetical protein